jgi:integrase
VGTAGRAWVRAAFRVKYVPRDRFLTPKDFVKLKRELSPARQLWVMVAVYTGGRLSEIEGLEWSDVDLLAGMLLRGTKTKKSRRWVPVPAALARELARVNERSGPVVGAWGNVRRDLEAACVKADIQVVTPNDLRRTYASWMKNASVDSAVVAKLLGQTSTRMVDLVYGAHHGRDAGPRGDLATG